MALGSIKLVSSGLEREAAVLQIADALEHFDQLCEQVFDQVNNRIRKCRESLKDIDIRTDVVNKKVSQISQINQAISVYAPAKYPQSIAYSDHSAIFGIDFMKSKCNSKTGALGLIREDGNRRLQTPRNITSAIEKKDQFFHVKTGKKHSEDDAVDFERALGPIPKDITSVADLLLFNTSLNPYKLEASEDGLWNIGKMRAVMAGEEKDNELSQQAPVSISHRQLNHRPHLNPFAYRPELERIEQFDVPQVLPNLPGVASDLCFSGDDFTPLSPTLSSVNLVPTSNLAFDVPTHSAAVSKPRAFLSSDSSRVESDFTKTVADHDEGTAAINFGSITPTNVVEHSVECATEEASTVAPPPPPPPPPPLAPLSGSTDNGGHSGLMEAIRAAGGTAKAKLRSVEQRKRDKKLLKKKDEDLGSGVQLVDVAASDSGVPSGDLMADLTKALMLRRKGISGQTSDSQHGGQKSRLDGAFSKMSQLIPPPPTDNGAESRNDSDGQDWDD